MKLVNILAVVVTAVTLNISVCALGEQVESSVEEAINNLESALNSNDINELKAIYSDEAMVVPAKSNIPNNKKEILNFWGELLKEGKSQYQIDVIDLRISNNIAYLSAIWSATVIGEDVNFEIHDGYMNSVLQRQNDGNWKIRIQNWN